MSPINLFDRAGVQYDDWSGTVAGDQVDFRSAAEMLGVDPHDWRLILVDVHISGGSQSLTAYAVPAAKGSFEFLKHRINETGRIEVTRIAELASHIEGHADTNPPTPPRMPLAVPLDMLVFAFKRLHIRLLNLPMRDLDELREIIEVGSIIEADEE
jgi:hypothetical protein